MCTADSENQGPAKVYGTCGTRTEAQNQFCSQGSWWSTEWMWITFHPPQPPQKKKKKSGFSFPKKTGWNKGFLPLLLFFLSCYKRFMNTWHVLWEDGDVPTEPHKTQSNLTVLLILYIQQRREPRTAPTSQRANSRSILFPFLLSTSSSFFPLLYPQ